MIRWHTHLDPVAVQHIRSLVDRIAAADGVAPIGGHLMADLTAQQVLLLDERGSDLLGRNDSSGELAAVAVRHSGDPVEFAVDPRHRRQGLGRLLGGIARTLDDGVWAHGNLPGAQALAAELAMTPTRTLLQQRRSLPSSITAPPPAGVRLRTFVPGQDEAAFLAVNARAFAWHPEQGRLDASGLAAEESQDWFDSNGFFLAVDEADDTVLGFHWTKAHPLDPTPAAGRGNPGPIGEIYVLGVDPQSPIRGLGAPLTAVGLDHLAAQGLSEVMLYVEGDNVPALRLYERFGFTTAVTDVVYR